MMSSVASNWICSEAVQDQLMNATWAFRHSVTSAEDLLISSNKVLRFLAVSAEPSALGNYGRDMASRQNRYRSTMVQSVKDSHTQIVDMRQIPPPLSHCTETSNDVVSVTSADDSSSFSPNPQGSQPYSPTLPPYTPPRSNMQVPLPDSSQKINKSSGIPLSSLTSTKPVPNMQNNSTDKPQNKIAHHMHEDQIALLHHQNQVLHSQLQLYHQQQQYYFQYQYYQYLNHPREDPAVVLSSPTSPMPQYVQSPTASPQPLVQTEKVNPNHPSDPLLSQTIKTKCDEQEVSMDLNGNTTRYM